MAELEHHVCIARPLDHESADAVIDTLNTIAGDDVAVRFNDCGHAQGIRIFQDYHEAADYMDQMAEVIRSVPDTIAGPVAVHGLYIQRKGRIGIDVTDEEIVKQLCRERNDLNALKSAFQMSINYPNVTIRLGYLKDGRPADYVRRRAINGVLAEQKLPPIILGGLSAYISTRRVD